MLNHLDWNRLRIFSFVFKHKSALKAAEELHLSAPAVSQHLKKLEQELGAPLFLRSHRKLVPLESAKKLGAFLEPFSKGLEEIAFNLSESRNELLGSLRIGAPKILGSTLLPHAIKAFQKKNPEVKFNTRLDLPWSLIESLQKGALDFIIIDAGNVFEKLYDISVSSFMEEPQMLVTSSKTFKKRKKPKTYEDLSALSFASHVPDGLDIKFWFKHHFGKSPNQIHVAYSCDDTRALVDYVTHSNCYSLIPSRLIENQLEKGSLIEINTGSKPYLNKIYVAQLPSQKPNRLEREFLKFLKAFAATYR